LRFFPGEQENLLHLLRNMGVSMAHPWSLAIVRLLFLIRKSTSQLKSIPTSTGW
jgi:hypothetical protein